MSPEGAETMRGGPPRQTPDRAGFTLIELLVTIAIIAALAAILFPAVTSNIRKGDAARAESVLDNLQTSIETFQLDVRSSPGKVSDLVWDPDGGFGNPDPLVGDTYGRVDGWSGPYLDRTIRTTATASSTEIGVGFGGELCNDMFLVSATSTSPGGWVDSNVDDAESCGDLVSDNNLPGGVFVGAAATGVDSIREFPAVDRAVDEGDGRDAGKVRLTGAGDSLMVYLLVPALPDERDRSDNP